MIYTGKGL